MMVLHSVLLALVLYVGMTMVLKIQPNVAESRSVAVGALVLLYMVAFGHKLPGRVNSHLLL